MGKPDENDSLPGTGGAAPPPNVKDYPSFEVLADFIPQFVWMCTPDGLNVYFNKRWVDYTGLTLEESYGKGWNIPFHPDDKQAALDAWNRATETGEPYQVESRLRAADGSYRWFLMRGEPLKDATGGVVHWFGSCTDIDDLKSRAQEKLQDVLDSITDGLLVLDKNWRYTYFSEHGAQMIGMRTENLLGGCVWDLFPHASGTKFYDCYHRAVETGQRVDFEEFYPEPLNKWLECHCFPSTQGLSVYFHDITARKQAEEAVRNSRKQLQDIIDGSPGVVFVKDLEGRFITANQTFERFLGVTKEELRGKTDYDLITRERAEYYREHDRRVAETGEPVQIEEAADLADGRQRVFLANKFPLRDASGKVYAVCAISTDITERKQAEERLRQSQKLESIGLLAGGVAHDFNNLLVGIVGNASLAQDMLPPDHPAADLISAVLKAGEQAAHLTRQMLAYSGKGKFVVETLNLSAVIPEMIGLVRPSISKNITLHLDLDEDLPSIAADRGQVQQVFMNLTLNAAEAIGGHEGLIAVRTGVEEVDDRFKRLHPETAALAPGQYVFLEVRDTGCGMDEATRAKIFDPFFSTKFVGRGLGLAAVDGIIRGHKGAIAVTSAPGQGSCFTVLLPPVAPAPAKPIAPVRSAAIQGSGTVLVVDDEPIVLGMAKKALERHGYTVLAADSGAAAIDIAKRHPGEIALVVLDLSMPHMGGEEALPELRKIRPDVKVVVSSGYSESEAMRLFDGQRVSGFIQKPYTSKGLAEKIKTSLKC